MCGAVFVDVMTPGQRKFQNRIINNISVQKTKEGDIYPAKLF